jgi:glycosyltransferase involved in cell wall biosynthesis
MISKACLVGPYQKKLEELARLPEIDLTVLVPPYWRSAGGVIELDRTHTTGYQLLVGRMLLNGSYHLHFYPGLGGQIRRLRPDVVHIDEEPYNLATAHALWLARRAGARSLFFSWQNIERRYPAPFRQMEQWVLHRVDYAIVGSSESADVWRAKGYHGPLAVIPQFGVDPQIFAPRTRPDHPGFVVGYVGRLVEEKGVDLLLEALAGMEGDWRASIAGTGPESAVLQSLARDLGIGERISFHGHIPASEMPDHFQQLDALVLPSRTRPNWKEQFGRVLVEAMACGVSVVGSDSGEIPHVIGDAGLVFPEGELEALRQLLVRLRQQPDLRADLARRGRQRVLDHYTQAQIAARTYQVYRGLT